MWNGLLNPEDLLVHCLMYKRIKKCCMIVPDSHGYTFTLTDSTLLAIFSDLYKSACSFRVCLSKNRACSKHGNNVHSGAQGQHRMTAIRPQLLKWKYAITCKLNLHTYCTVCTHASACFIPKPSMMSLFSVLDWNFYNTTWRILLGASFECCGGGIWWQAQQTSSCLSTWEEEEHLEYRQHHRTLCCLR